MDSNVLNYEEIVERKLSNELEVFAAARGKSNIHESLSGTAEQISVSYRGRTLIELIQNGYDPHPPDRNDGEISILLDLSDGENGCLYVANRGAGFAQTNFEGLCDIARSSKVVNQGIGNKGFGFRSVRQICKYPEIFSKAGQDSTKDDFDGFCFAFPSDQRLRDLLTKTEHADYADEIVKIMPRLLLPAFTHDRPGHVPRFAKEGFATVIRMPLDREDSATDIRDQINAICDSELPIQLFLNRVAQINIEVIFEPSDSDDEAFSRKLPRHIIDQWTRDDISLEVVQIDDENQYLVSKRQLPEDEFKPQLLAGIESEELPDSWANWKDPAEISIAIPLNGSGRSGRLYNFLPMESAAISPCAGHINAPFLCDIDRKKLVDDVELNSYFLIEVAALCLSTADDIKESHPDLAQFAVIDLTMWLNGLTDSMTEVAQNESGQEFKVLPLVPTAKKSGPTQWASLEDIYAWPETDEPLRVLTADAVGNLAGVDFLDPAIRGARLDRIVEVAKKVKGATLDPIDEKKAEWAEQAAEDLNRRNESIEIWNQFYVDLTHLFADSAEALRGRRVLLTNDKKLTHALVDDSDDQHLEGSPRRRKRMTGAVFLPSTRPPPDANTETASSDVPDDTEVSDELLMRIPKSLHRFIQLVNANLNCAQRIDETGVRRFFVDNRLVNQFQTEDIQRLLAILTGRPGPGRNPDKRRMAALQFAFELADRGQRRADLTEMKFRVPGRDGQWVRATQAYFGPTWPGTRGKQIAELVEETKSFCEDHQNIFQNMLADFSDWPTKNDTAKDWTKFLRNLGVNDKIQLRNIRPRGRLLVQGYSLRSTLLDRCGIEGSTRENWDADLPSEIRNPYTEYTVRGPIPFLPGQNEYDQFAPNTRALFAREIIVALEGKDESVLTIRVLRPDRYDSNETFWPSPISSLLRQVKWLPVQSADSKEHFSQPNDAWQLPHHTLPSRLDFLPTVRGDARSLLDGQPDLCELLQQHCGLSVINSSSSAAKQVRVLGKLAVDGKISRGSTAAFDSLYSAAWESLPSDSDALTNLLESPPFYIAAHAGADVVGFELNGDSVSEEPGQEASSDQIVYLADDRAPTTRDLLKELDHPVFDFKFQNRAKLTSELHRRFKNLQLISEVKLDIFADGSRFTGTGNEDLLAPVDRRWLQDTILIVCDLAAGFLNLGSSALDKLRARIAKLRYRLVGDIEIEIDGLRIPLPDFAQGCLLYNDEQSPTILIQTDDTNLSWTVLQQASHALAEGLGYPVQLSAVLGSAFAQFAQRHGVDALDRPNISDLQAVCRKGQQAVEESRRGLRQVTESLIELARPVIFAVANEYLAKEFESDAQSLDNETDLLLLLERLESQLPLSAKAILDACRRNDDLDGVRRELDISLPDLNAALRRLGLPYHELSFAEEHKLQFRAFVTENQSAILESLRAAHVASFDAVQPLIAYVEARGLAGLIPDEEWAVAYDALPIEIMGGRVNEWLSTHDAQPFQDASPLDGLELADCRATNREALRKLASEGWPIVSAWCRKNGTELPVAWRTLSQAQQALGTLGNEQGWLDFRLLDHEALIQWLVLTENWPVGMPTIIDQEALGLKLDAIAAEFEAEKREKIEQARLDSIVNIGKHELSADQPNLSEALDELISDYAENNSVFETPTRLTTLSQLDSLAKKSKSSGDRGSSKSRAPRDLPAAKKILIGLLGERIAFEWLKASYPNAVNEESWASTNRKLGLQTGGGNDYLGYDFFVNRPSYVLYYEVKATTGEDLFFRLGPTEVEAAIKFRADAKHRFRILFIQNVADPDRTKISVLPNPYSNQYKDRFRLVTKGELGFRFSLPS